MAHVKPANPTLDRGHWAVSGLRALYAIDPAAGDGTTDRILDYSGNKHHGTLSGFTLPGAFVGERYGYSLDMTSTSQEIQGAAGNLVLPNTTTSATMHIIFTPDNVGSSDSVMTFQVGVGQKFAIDLGYSSGQWAMRFRTAADVNTLVNAGASTAVAGQPSHVTHTLDSNGSKIYVDGVLKNTDATASVSRSLQQNDSTAWVVGRSAGSRTPNGRCHLAAIWDRALTAEQVKALYEDPFGFLKPRRGSIYPIGTTGPLAGSRHRLTSLTNLGLTA